ncbi:MAG: alpha-amylase family glycosyl hydrolase [Bacteroidota bacterium]
MKKLAIFLLFLAFISCKEEVVPEDDPPTVGKYSDLILYNMRIDRFVPEEDFLNKKSFVAATTKLDYLADLGITGIVLEPIAEGFTPGFDNNGGYIDSNDPNNSSEVLGGHSWNFFSQRDQRIVDPALGTKEEFQTFVSEAHNRGIKVFVEFVFHGMFHGSVIKDASHPNGYPNLTAPVINEHPEFFYWNNDGSIKISPSWNSAIMKWEASNVELQTWYHDVLLSWLDDFQVDGFFLDLEPHEVAEKIGYDYWDLLKEKAEARGHDILLVPEGYKAGRFNTFPFAQGNFRISDPRVNAEVDNPVYDFMVTTPHRDPNWNNWVEPVNIVDVVLDYRERPAQYYTSAISCLNSKDYNVKGLAQMAYGAIISPFIPFWFAGEEFHANGKNYDPNNPFFDRLYFTRIDWSLLNQNQSFFSDVKKLISIRKEYQYLIAPFEQNLYKTKIATANTEGYTDLPSYILFGENSDGKKQAILVIATKETTSASVKVSFNPEYIKMSENATFQFTNLMTGTKLERTDVESGVDVEGIDPNGVLIYLLE